MTAPPSLVQALIYAQLSAWGQTGPMSENPGYDAGAYWAASGLQDYMRTDEDAEPPRFPGGIGDHTASMQLFGGIALALFHRKVRKALTVDL